MHVTTAHSGAPVNMEAYSVNSTYAHISWLSPNTWNQSTPIVHYKITVNSKENKSVNNYMSNDNFTDLTYLHPDYHYTITVEAFTNAFGPSASVNIRTLEDSE